MAQSVKRPTSAQVMILWFMGSSPVWGSVLTAQSLELLQIFSPSLSLCPSPIHALSLFPSLSKINKHLKKIFLMFPLIEPLSLDLA